nr:hypothetical protein [Bacteroidota bacterium]
MKHLTLIYARIKALFLAFVTTRFSLKAGDVVIVRWNKSRVEATVEGFYCYGMKLKGMGVFPFNAGRLYGCGYNSGPVYTLRKDWHYIPAKICEWWRLKLSQKVGARIFGF